MSLKEELKKEMKIGEKEKEKLEQKRKEEDEKRFLENLEWLKDRFIEQIKSLPKELKKAARDGRTEYTFSKTYTDDRVLSLYKEMISLFAKEQDLTLLLNTEHVLDDYGDPESGEGYRLAHSIVKITLSW